MIADRPPMHAGLQSICQSRGVPMGKTIGFSCLQTKNPWEIPQWLGEFPQRATSGTMRVSFTVGSALHGMKS